MFWVDVFKSFLEGVAGFFVFLGLFYVGNIKVLEMVLWFYGFLGEIYIKIFIKHRK